MDFSRGNECGNSTNKLIIFLETRILISNFRRVVYVVCFLLVNSPASEFYIPTFRNTLSVPSSQAGRCRRNKFENSWGIRHPPPYLLVLFSSQPSPVWIPQQFSDAVILHLPAYENGTGCSETSAYRIQTPGNYPEESIQQKRISFCLLCKRCTEESITERSSL